MGIYIFGILVAWNFIGLRTLLYPVKMLIVAYHEVCAKLPLCVQRKITYALPLSSGTSWLGFVWGKK